MNTQRHPRDMDWNKQRNTPDVMQTRLIRLPPDVRITWNPDDDRFYVEQQEPLYDDWETSKTFCGNIKGWDNAKYHARHL